MLAESPEVAFFEVEPTGSLTIDDRHRFADAAAAGRPAELPFVEKEPPGARAARGPGGAWPALRAERPGVAPPEAANRVMPEITQRALADVLARLDRGGLGTSVAKPVVKVCLIWVTAGEP
jgi:hypothetical protein